MLQDSLILYLYLMLFCTYSVITTWLAINMFSIYISVCEGSKLLECIVTVMGYVGVRMWLSVSFKKKRSYIK